MNTRTKSFIENVRKQKYGGLMIKYTTDTKIMHSLEYDGKWRLIINNLATGEIKKHIISTNMAILVIDRYFKYAKESA